MIYKITVKGAVQGVGYRPFILKKATEYGLKGFVRNIGAAVDILVFGEEKTILDFVRMLKSEYPSGAFILSVEKKLIDKSDYDRYIDELSLDYTGLKLDRNLEEPLEFSIIDSREVDLSSELPVFLPDIGICDDCMSEMLDKKDRRYNYPLISCASCGPRISILNKLPYDRKTTAMIDFEMCPDCAREYKTGRRLHAQTISCHNCGPQYEIKYLSYISDSDDNTNDKIDIINIIRNDISDNNSYDSVKNAIKLLENNEIIGLKGSSGYQLVCKPVNEAALKLRNAKGREKKPFAVMFSDIDSIEEYCFVNSKEKELLKSSARPIVLLNTKESFDYEVCKDSRYIGAFLPSVGIHRLLCDAVGPLIVTSANRSDEPIIIDDDIFIKEFTNTQVQAVLMHKRRINMPQDDSVMYTCTLHNGNTIGLFNRRARGFVPLPVYTSNKGTASRILAYGGDLKSTFSFAYKDKIIPSQYLGDLRDYGVNDNLQKLISQFEGLYKFVPEKIVCDMHPLYESVRLATEYADKHNLPIFKVQHHHAHILSVMAEKGLKSCIGVSFDGTGYGIDGNIWGGEFMYLSGSDFERDGHMSYVNLCGGDNASRNAKLVKECYYNAAGYSDKVSTIIRAALDNNINVFTTSSVGRLFDCISSLLRIRDENSFEGECAIALEKAAWEFAKANGSSDSEGIYRELNCDILQENDHFIADQLSLFRQIEKAFYQDEIPANELAFSFHMALTDTIVRMCQLIRNKRGENKVCLSGGVFGNRLLLSKTIDRLSDFGFDVYVNEQVPAGDAGISVGQAYYLMLKEE